MLTTIANQEPITEIALPLSLQTILQSKTAELCVLPETAVKAIRATDDPDCTVHEFARIVERDVKLAADILALANSALYCGNRPVGGLGQAVSRLGFRRCRNLLVASSLASLMRRISLEQEWIREQLCHHGFITALLAAEITQQLKIDFEGEDFTAGLVHDLGRTILAVALPQRFSEFDSLLFDEDDSLLRHEFAVIESDHCQVGAWFALNSGLPLPLVSAIANHHHPELATDHQLLATLTAAADHAANHLQRAEEARGYDPASNKYIGQMEHLGVKNAVERFTANYAEIMTTALERVSDFA